MNMRLTFLMVLCLTIISCKNQEYNKSNDIIKKDIAYKIKDFKSSPDGKTYAYVAKENLKYFVVNNGKEGKRYDWIQSLTFSPDSKILAYEAKNGMKSFVVTNDRRGNKYDSVRSIIFSSDSKKIAYIAYILKPDIKKEMYASSEHFLKCIVVNEKEGKKYDDVYMPVFSPDNKMITYVANKNKRSYLIYGKKEIGEKYDGVGPCVFNAHNITYIARKGEKMFVVYNGKEGKWYDHARQLMLSPDRETIAYVAQERLKWFVVIGEEEGKRYDSIMDPIFIPDSKTLAYTAREGSKSFIVMGEKEGNRYDFVDSLVFSADGKRIAYRVNEGGIFPNFFSGPGKPLPGGGEWFIVFDNQEGKRYSRYIDPPFFSPDGRTIGYKIKKEDFLWSVVINEKEGKRYHSPLNPVFSPDSANVAYRVIRGKDKINKKGQFIVINGEESEGYKHLTNPIWLDNNRLTYFVSDGIKVNHIIRKVK